jgi:hypothetical protein
LASVCGGGGGAAAAVAAAAAAAAVARRGRGVMDVNHGGDNVLQRGSGSAAFDILRQAAVAARIVEILYEAPDV